jgi:hypothetical protein
MTRSDALLPENHELVLAELTFGAPDRVKISWLEYWFYMCNQNEDIDDIITDVPLWASVDDAVEAFENEAALAA